MKIVVVIPTYNEALNIGRLIENIETVFKEIKSHEMLLLIVDGNSPDGTSKEVTKLQSTRPWLYLLLEKEKKGIGAAYFFGFDHAMHNMHADAVVEMDGDFQHDPQDLIKLIQPLDDGYDHIVGSRFIKGGSIPKNWEFYRKFLSVCGNIFTKIVLGIYSVNDFTTGYKVTRVKGFLDSMNFEKIRSKGFAYKVEMLYLLHKMGAKIKQVPITFGLRDRGNSKMEGDNFMDTLTLVVSLKVKEKKSFVKFCIVGGAGFITDATVFNLLTWYLFQPKTSALFAGFIAMTVTFILNNKWSFGERQITKISDQLKSFLGYVSVSFIPIVFRSQLVAFAVNSYGHNFYIYNAAFIIGVGLGLIWNYIIYSRVIWKKNKL